MDVSRVANVSLPSSYLFRQIVPPEMRASGGCIRLQGVKRFFLEAGRRVLSDDLDVGVKHPGTSRRKIIPVDGRVQSRLVADEPSDPLLSREKPVAEELDRKLIRIKKVIFREDNH